VKGLEYDHAIIANTDSIGNHKFYWQPQASLCCDDTSSKNSNYSERVTNHQVRLNALEAWG